MALTKEQLEVLQGIDPADLAALVGRSHRAETEVRVNDEDNRKFGDVSIYKVQENGYSRPKTGLFTDGIPTLIEQLQDAYAELKPEQEFAPFALVTEEDSDDQESE